ncbi:hypothetical protein [Nostoc sp.]
MRSINTALKDWRIFENKGHVIDLFFGGRSSNVCDRKFLGYKRYSN